jgi:hypothetical protein
MEELTTETQRTQRKNHHGGTRICTEKILARIMKTRRHEKKENHEEHEEKA